MNPIWSALLENPHAKVCYDESHEELKHIRRKQIVNFTNILRAALPLIFLRKKSTQPNFKPNYKKAGEAPWSSGEHRGLTV